MAQNTSNAHASAAKVEFDVPAKVGKYQLLERIGSGTCGIVYRAYDAILSRDVAIKVSQVGTLDQQSGKMPGAQKAFITETLSAGRLSHPNIVTVYDAGIDGPLNYLVMEYVEGVSLKQYGRGKEQLSPHRVVSVIAEVCKAIDFSHRKGIVHRDIKPANIMIASDGSVKLLDFGIAISTTADEAAGTGRPALGTPNYVSPEQVSGSELGPRSDIYSLGTVLFEMLTGQQVFKARDVKELFKSILNEPAPRLTSVRADLPRDLEQVVTRALAKNPGKRYSSGAEMSEALEDVLERMAPPDMVAPEMTGWVPVISQLKYFSKFSERKVACFASVSKVVRFSAGASALRKSTIDNHLYVIIEGVASISGYNGLSAVIGPGDCFGEAGFLHGNKCDNDIEVMTDIVALKVKSTDVKALSEADQLAHYQMIANSIVQRRNHTEDLMLDLAL